MLGEKKKGWYSDHLSLHHIPPQCDQVIRSVGGRTEAERPPQNKAYQLLSYKHLIIFFKTRREVAIQTGEVVVNLN